MSKAILVIDLPDNLNKCIDEIRIDIKANLYGNELLDWRNQTIKPMPGRIVSSLIVDGKVIEDGYQCGWNECLDEIIGEDND